MGQHYQGGIGADGGEDIVGIGGAVAGARDPGDFHAALRESGKRPGDGIMLDRRGDDVVLGSPPVAAQPAPAPGSIPERAPRCLRGRRGRAGHPIGCQQPLQGDVERMGGVQCEDHPRLVRDVEQRCHCLPRVQEVARGLQRKLIGAATGVGAHVGESLGYRLDHLRRLGTRSGGVVEIDHAFPRAGVSLRIVPSLDRGDMWRMVGRTGQTSRP